MTPITEQDMEKFCRLKFETNDPRLLTILDDLEKNPETGFAAKYLKRRREKTISLLRLDTFRPNSADHTSVSRDLDNEMTDPRDAVDFESLQTHDSEEPSGPEPPALNQPRLKWPILVGTTVAASLLVTMFTLFLIQPWSGPPLVTLHDGNYELELDPQGRIVDFGTLPADLHRPLENLLHEGSFGGSPNLDKLLGKSTPPATDPYPDLIAPVLTVVESQQPLFAWNRIEDAQKYTVAVFGDNGNVPLAQSDKLTSTTWRPTEQLERGQIFTWSVTATIDGSREFLQPGTARPRFAVLSEEDQVALKSTAANLRGSQLLLADLYFHYGLLDRAEKTLLTLQQANPRSQVVADFLSQVRTVHRGGPP